MTAQQQSRRASLFIPLLLIGGGIWALGTRLGWFTLNIGQMLATFWPLLLIGLGLDLIFGRRRPWVGGVLALLVIAGIIATTALLGTNVGAGSATPQPFSDPVAGIRSARVVFDGRASNININALPQGAAQVVKGTFVSNRSTLQHQFSVDDGVADIRLNSEKYGWSFFGNTAREWDVAFSPAVPLEMQLNFSAVSIDADLRELKVSSLTLDISAGDGTVTLPATSNAVITIDAKAASLSLVVPAGVEARITADTSASSLEVDGRFQQQGQVYTTAGWEHAKSRLDIILDASAAAVDVK